ncbi:MAG: methylated-DNA--[protein]-cysteine S-methyltransferase, partial [Planctomycetaceae bacterium]
WQALRQIPWGTTASYAQIAAAIGRPRACRAVGLANGRNPLPLIIPCHRVIGSSGQLVGYSAGLHIKRILLELENSPLP